MTVEGSGDVPINDLAQYRHELDLLPKRRLTFTEEETLRGRLLQGDEAVREVVVTSNLRLAMKIALGVRRKVDLLDIIQAGNLGLVEAAGKYEHVETGKFQYYAATSIRNKIFEHLYEHNLVNIPPDLQKLIKPFLKAESTLLQDLFHEPTIEEIAERLNIPFSQARDVAQAIHRSDLLSLNIGMFDDSSEEYADRVVEKRKSANPDQIIQQDFQETYSLEDKLTRNRLLKALAVLPPRQRQILCMQYGLADDVSKNFEDIAKELKLTPQSVGETVKKAVINLSTQTPENAMFTAIMEGTDGEEIRRVLTSNVTNIHLRDILSNLFDYPDFKEMVFQNQSFLTGREREIVSLYHEKHLMFKEIGMAFGGLNDATIREKYQSAINKMKAVIIDYLALR